MQHVVASCRPERAPAAVAPTGDSPGRSPTARNEYTDVRRTPSPRHAPRPRTLISSRQKQRRSVRPNPAPAPLLVSVHHGRAGGSVVCAPVRVSGRQRSVFYSAGSGGRRGRRGGGEATNKQSGGGGARIVSWSARASDVVSCSSPLPSSWPASLRALAGASVRPPGGLLRASSCCPL